jgi:hypothetical protein
MCGEVRRRRRPTAWIPKSVRPHRFPPKSEQSELSLQLRKHRLLGPKVLRELLPGSPRRNLVISLVTVGEDNYPNVCLLSPFQVVAKNDHTIFFVVYSGSRTRTNLSKCRSATLALFLPPAAYYIKGEAKQMALPRGVSELRGQVLHRLRVTQVARDYYRKAPITSTVKFEQGGVLPYYSEVYRSLAEIIRRMV